MFHVAISPSLSIHCHNLSSSLFSVSYIIHENFFVAVESILLNRLSIIIIMIHREISFVFVVMVLSFTFTLARSSSIFYFWEQLETDQDIFIREYSNSSCTFFRSLFAKEYRHNDTTTCKCVRTDWMSCTTTNVINATTTTLSPVLMSSSETPTASKSNIEIGDEAETEEKMKLNKVPEPAYFGHFY